MKVITYLSEGRLIIVHPVEGQRLAHGLYRNGTYFKLHIPGPVDSIFMQWPLLGATAEWAESEDEFVERVRKTLPEDAQDVRIVNKEDLPKDRKNRDSWSIP